MTINEKLATIQTKFKSKKSGLTHSANITSDQPKTFSKQQKPFLLELGVTVTVNEELISTDPMPVIQTTATITDGDGTITATSVVGVDLNQKGMQAPQQFGSASSYAKKYALGNLFLIDDTQDSDATNNHGKAKSKLTDIIAAKNFIANGGKIDAIKKKYQLTSAQEAELKTL